MVKGKVFATIGVSREVRDNVKKLSAVLGMTVKSYTEKAIYSYTQKLIKEGLITQSEIDRFTGNSR